MKKVSVIIPTYNSWSTLKSSILSIQKQAVKPKEIIIVDNASTDDTSEKVKQYFPKVKLITLSANTGVTGGRNEGIKRALSSDYLLFFDHDMVADKNMLKELIKVAESNNLIGIVTPKIYYWGNRNRIWSAGTGINLWSGQILFRGGDDIGQYEKAEEVQVAPAALLVKRKALNKIGLFDDIYFATYEDTDFCFRAKEKGYKTFYAPNALAYHKISWDPKDDANRVLSRAYWVGRNRIIFMKRFGSHFYFFLLMLPIFMLYYLKIALENNRLIDWFKFIQGTFAGILPDSLFRKAIFLGERPSLSDIEGQHLAKYKFALPFCRGKKILEIGCGSGYGSNFLAENGVDEITAFDIDPAAIDFARRNSQIENIKFLQGDAEILKIKEQYDVILSFEVIEHLNQPLKLIELARKNIKQKGVFIIATPNKKYSIQDGDKPSNPYHLYEYYPEELKKILLKYFDSVELYGVILMNQEILRKEKKMHKSLKWKLINYLVNKREIRKLMNHFPEYPKRLISGESRLKFKTEDFRVVRNRADDATDFVAVCKGLR